MQYANTSGIVTQKGLQTILQERCLYHNDMGHPAMNLLCGDCNDVTLRDEQFKLVLQCCCRTVMRFCRTEEVARRNC